MICQRCHSSHVGRSGGRGGVWRRRRRRWRWDDEYDEYDEYDGDSNDDKQERQRGYTHCRLRRPNGQERRRDTNVVQGIKTRWDDEPYAFEDTLRPDHLDMNEKRNGGFVSGNNDQVRNPDDFMVRGDDDKDMPGTDSVYFDTQLVPGNVQEMPSEGGYQGPAMDVRPGPGFSDMPPPVISILTHVLSTSTPVFSMSTVV